jgi:hypothetical protein
VPDRFQSRKPLRLFSSVTRDSTLHGACSAFVGLPLDYEVRTNGSFFASLVFSQLASLRSMTDAVLQSAWQKTVMLTEQPASTLIEEKAGSRPSLQRAMLFDSGSCFGLFADSTAILLHKKCESFVAVDADGNQSTHYTPYAQTSCLPQLAALLRYRNSCGSVPVCLSKRLHVGALQKVWPARNAPGCARSFSLILVQLDVPVAYARWPLGLLSTDHDGRLLVKEGEDGTVTVNSVDRLCALTWSPHSKLVRVSWPAPLSRDIKVCCCSTLHVL